jgi:hypothetical protein
LLPADRCLRLLKALLGDLPIFDILEMFNEYVTNESG